MLRFFLICIVFGFSLSCVSSQAVSENNLLLPEKKENVEKIEDKTEIKPETKKVLPDFKPNAKQRNFFNAALPPKVRNFLENAETLEILAQIEKKDGQITYTGNGKEFKPNTKVIVSDAEIRKEVLAQFYFDTATSKIGSPACYNPHHLIRARKDEKIVEVEICFDCSRFVVKGSLGESKGLIGFGAGEVESEYLFNRLINAEGVSIQ